jgi:hypothetical protein
VQECAIHRHGFSYARFPLNSHLRVRKVFSWCCATET